MSVQLSTSKSPEFVLFFDLSLHITKISLLIIDLNCFNLRSKFRKTMGDEGQVSTNNSTQKSEAGGNQDEMILAQQRQIEKEISESIPLVGPLDSIDSLASEYSADDIYLAKVKDLGSKYSSIRRTRPDGNCFFRAFSYATLERLLGDKEEFKKFYKIAENSKAVLVELGFQKFTVEDFYETYMEVLNKLAEIENVDDARRELHIIFNEQGYSDYMVVYLRLLTSAQLQKEEDFYSCFIEGNRTVADFCHQEVEPMYKDSDHIHIMAACSAFNTGVRVVYMDRGTGTNVTQHDLPEGSTPTVHLLYRPSHYDILYV